MRIGYLGSPLYSKILLEEISKKHEIICVISNPDSISDRSRKPKPTPVSELALKKGWNLFRPQNLKNLELWKQLQDLQPDVFIVFAYGKIIPIEMITIPEYQSLNLHASLLPDLRGASPLQTAILKGYSKSGWTLQKISEKMDAGDIIKQIEFSIEDIETTEDVLKRVLPLGIQLVLEVLENLPWYLEHAKPQNHKEATYCYKITNDMAWISWEKTTQEIHNQIRAFNPNPIAKTKLEKDSRVIENIKIYRSNRKISEEQLSRFQDISEFSTGECVCIKYQKKYQLFVKTGDGWIEILEIQFPGKKKLSAHECINGKLIQKGDRFI